MAKRCIAIELTHSHLRAVQMVRTADGPVLEKVFRTRTRRASDSPAQIMENMVSQHGFDRRAKLAISLPAEMVFYRRVTIDPSTDTKTEWHRLADPAVPAADAITQICWRRTADEGESQLLLLAITQRQHVEQVLRRFGRWRRQIVSVEPIVPAVFRSLTYNHPESRDGRVALIHVQDTHLSLVVAEDGIPLVLRTIPLKPDVELDPVRQCEQWARATLAELQLSWQRAFGTGSESQASVYVADEWNLTDFLKVLVEEQLAWQIRPVDAYARTGRPAGADGQEAFHGPEGLALAVLSNLYKPVNFLNSPAAASQKPALNLKRELATTTSLALAAGLLLIIALFLRLWGLEKTYAQLNDQIRQTFQSALPEENNIVNPVAQLDQQLQRFRSKYEMFGAVGITSCTTTELLSQISRQTPQELDIVINDLFIGPGTIRITGTCSSFETLSQWQRLLQESVGLKVLDVRNVYKLPQKDRVQFTLVLSYSM